MKKTLTYPFLFTVLLFSNPEFDLKERLVYIAPTTLPAVTREMKTAGFWISRHPAPDKLILTADDIKTFNNQIKDLKLTKDILQLPAQFSGAVLKTALQKTLEDLKGRKLYFKGKPAGEEFFSEAKANLNLEAIPVEGKTRFGFIVHFADQRFLPTQEALNEIPNDIDFDELQNSDLDCGTVVAALHESLDKKWLYVQTDTSDGWVQAERVALCELDDLKKYLSHQPFAVVTSAKADIFLNPEKIQHYDYVRMGTKFPLAKEQAAHSISIIMPTRNENGMLVLAAAYMNKEDVSQGFLSYTPRTILAQAFKMLNSPYGWGGMHGEQDCSRFLGEVFSTVGIMLPRDSKEQAQVGRQVVSFDNATKEKQKLEALAQNGIGAVTILPLKGHIMIYLGIVNGNPYAIHAMWAYREKGKPDDLIRTVNRIIVSDLSLGEGSHKGSLLKRMTSIVTIAK